MEQRRRHKRYNVEIMNINGRVALSNTVIIKAIDSHGVHLCADVRLDLGKIYNLRLESGLKGIIVRGVVESSALNTGMDGTGKKKEGGPFYCGQITFKDIPQEGQEIIDALVRQYREEEDFKLSRVALSRDVPEETPVGIVEYYRVKKISLGGMLVECGNEFEIGSTHSFTLSLSEHTPLSIGGRVASCLPLGGEQAGKYDIGIAFSDIPEKDRERLKEFIRLLENPDAKLMDVWRHEKTKKV